MSLKFKFASEPVFRYTEASTEPSQKVAENNDAFLPLSCDIP